MDDERPTDDLPTRLPPDPLNKISDAPSVESPAPTIRREEYDRAKRAPTEAPRERGRGGLGGLFDIFKR